MLPNNINASTKNIIAIPGATAKYALSRMSQDDERAKKLLLDLNLFIILK